MHTARWKAASGILAAVVALSAPTALAQKPSTPPSQAVVPGDQQPTFRAGIDLVTIRAVVRDGKGRSVQGLTLRTSRSSTTAKCASRRPSSTTTGRLASRCSSTSAAAWNRRALRPRARGRLLPPERPAQRRGRGGDLHVRHVAAPGAAVHDRARSLRGSLSGCQPLGHDVAPRRDCRCASRSMDVEGHQAPRAGRADRRLRQRERLDAAEVSRIAQRIDVPVYIFAVVPSIDNPRRTHDARQRGARTAEPRRPGATGPAATLRRHATPAQRQRRRTQIVDELRAPVL